MKHIVFFSSGIASWMAAKRVAAKHGVENLFLVFADTLIEDEDNYRFLQEAAANVGGTLILLKDGRTPWDVFKEKRFINHRQSNCSLELKVKPCRAWTEAHVESPQEAILYFGIGWVEQERIPAITKGWQPFVVEFPLLWEEWVDAKAIDAELRNNNLRRPRMYDMGFAHSNCGGFCPKAGQKHYRNLLKNFPERYREHEEEEQRFMQLLNRKDIGIIRKEGKVLSLREWRQIIESEPKQLSFDFDLIGGCGCFLE